MNGSMKLKEITMKKNKLMLFVGVFSLVGTFCVYNKLPTRIPIHWGLDGTIDRFGDRMFVFFTGSLPLFMYVLYLIIPKIDPRKDSYEKHANSYKIIILAIVLFLIEFHWVSILFSLGYGVNMPLIIKLSIGILFIVVGNYMPLIKHNYTLGIRTPWTLASEIVWEKTHRVGGYLWVLSGFTWAFFAFLNQPWVFFALMGQLVLCLMGIIVYSYILFRNIS